MLKRHNRKNLGQSNTMPNKSRTHRFDYPNFWLCLESLCSIFSRRSGAYQNNNKCICCDSTIGSDGECARNNGDIDDDRTVHYFNHASQAPLSDGVKKLGAELIQANPWDNIYRNHSAQDSQERVRSLFAALIDGEEVKKESKNNSIGSRIAIFPSTAFAISLAARNIVESRRKRKCCNNGGRILVLQDQFDSAIYPWQQVCDESKGQYSLEILGYPDHKRGSGDSKRTIGASGWTQAILEKLEDDRNGEEIIAACLPPLHWSDGSLLDLEVIGAACRDRNIPLVVDATQAIGIMPCSIRKIRPVMLACSTHKWLRGPSGCCLAYISPEVQEDWLPLDFHGRGRDFEAGSTSWDVSRNEMGPRGYPEKYYGDARKFDSGGKANPLLLPMLQKAMEEIECIDVAAAQVQLRILMQPLLDWASEHGYSINTGPRAYHIIGLVPNEKTPEEMIEIAKILQTKNRIILAVRCGRFRISPYLTNTPTDVEQLIDGLEALS